MSRTDPTRPPELMSRERAALDALLDATIVGHIDFVAPDGGPMVLPTAAIRWVTTWWCTVRQARAGYAC